jgi:hypothetical protein
MGRKLRPGYAVFITGWPYTILKSSS